MKFKSKYFPLILSILFASCNLVNPDGGNHTLALNEIYSIHLDGSNLRKLSDNSFPFLLAGNYIIINNSAGTLTEMNLDGSNSHNLLPSNIGTYDFSVSPDGTKLVFSTGSNLYMMNNNGNGLYKLSLPDTITNVTTPSLSFNDSAVTFVNKTGLYKINVDGTNFRKLKSSLSDSNIIYVKPIFTADNQNIIYATFNSSAFYFTGLHLLKLKDSSDSVFYNGINIGYPNYKISPQNNLLFDYYGPDIVLINLNNFKVSDIGRGSYCNYSYDYNKITFINSDTSKIICTMSLNTLKTTELNVNIPNKGTFYITRSKLSSDGTTLIFVSYRLVND